jgi:UDP-N-acetylmuramoyl-tripeptide--D-alanyl-D-alanine ligase
MAIPLGSQPRYVRSVIALLSRTASALGPVYRVPLVTAARCWRLVLWRTTFIAITGSVGKTTTKEALARGLSATAPTMRSPGTANVLIALSRTILQVRPWHRFAVLEVGTGGPGSVGPSAQLVRPDIAVITCVERQHLMGFNDLEEIATEKAMLLTGLRPGGIAVLNRDDSRVVQMKPPAGCSILWFGQNESADCCILSSASQWPDRLTLGLDCHGEKLTVDTELLGGHWERSIAAAVAAGIACGVPAAEICSAISGLTPTVGRMQPLDLGQGVTMVRDDINGSFVTLEKALEFLRSARCERRVFVGSDITDLDNRPARRRAQLLGELVAKSSDCAVFVGKHAARAKKGAVSAGMSEDSIHSAAHWTEAVDVVRRTMQPGDLIVVKGPATQHLARIALSLIGSVECREDNCGRTGECDYCPQLGFRPNPPRAAPSSVQP